MSIFMSMFKRPVKTLKIFKTFKTFKTFKRIISAAAVITMCMSETAFAQGSEAPDVRALGAVLMDAKSGRVLWEKNGDEPLPNASTTKILTCIIALESGMTDETVTVSKNAAAQPETSMGLAEGEQIKLGDLLYPLMLQSSNDAAVAIAEHISGSTEEFCQLMNERAREMGAADTLFETPNGLDKGEHHSTARDLAVITAYALENEDFREIISTPEKTVKSDRRTYIAVNKDRLLNEYEGALGVKTGFTGLAGHCFVGAAQRDGMTLISVVLGSGWGSTGKERKWTDTKNLLNYGFENFEYHTLCQAGEYVADIGVKNAYTDSVRTVLTDTVELPLTEEERASLSVEVILPKEAEAPISAGQKLGELVFMDDDGQVLAACGIAPETDVNKKDVKTTAQMLINYWINPKKSDILKDNA